MTLDVEALRPRLKATGTKGISDAEIDALCDLAASAGELQRRLDDVYEALGFPSGYADHVRASKTAALFRKWQAWRDPDELLAEFEKYEAAEQRAAGGAGRETLDLTIKLLREIARRTPEVLQHTDIEAFILNELNPAKVAAPTPQREGWQWVPKEMTPEMIEATKPAFKQIDAWCGEMQMVRGRKADWPDNDPPLKQAWRAALAAAPRPGEKE